MFSPYIVYTITALLFGLKSANFLYVYCVCSYDPPVQEHALPSAALVYVRLIV